MKKKNLLQTAAGRVLLALTMGVVVLAVTLFFTTRISGQTVAASQPKPDFTAQAGPFAVTLAINPKSPVINQASHLTLHVTQSSTGQPITNAEVQVQGVMDSMGMLTRALYADSQGDGSYTTATSFDMSGQWRLQVTITIVNAPSASTQFVITTL